MRARDINKGGGGDQKRDSGEGVWGVDACPPTRNIIFLIFDLGCGMFRLLGFMPLHSGQRDRVDFAATISRISWP